MELNYYPVPRVILVTSKFGKHWELSWGSWTEPRVNGFGSHKEFEPPQAGFFYLRGEANRFFQKCNGSYKPFPRKFPPLPLTFEYLFRDPRIPIGNQEAAWGLGWGVGSSDLSQGRDLVKDSSKVKQRLPVGGWVVGEGLWEMEFAGREEGDGRKAGGGGQSV